MQTKFTKKQKKIAIVMGCHRTGTSLIAATLKHFGAYLGVNLHGASEENEKGFFENIEIINFNDHLLEFLNGCWDNPLFDGRQSLATISEKKLEPWFGEAEKIFRETFGNEDFCAIKDPRMCQLLPFWQQVLQRCGYRDEMIYYVHISRHPIEVAYSQRKRKQANPVFYAMGDSILETVALWFSLNIQALRYINSDNNIFFIYDNLLKYPHEQLERFLNFFKIQTEKNRIAAFSNEFIDNSLRHHGIDVESITMLETCFPAAIQLFKGQQVLASKNTFARTDAHSLIEIWNQPETQKHFTEAIYPFLSRIIHERHKSFLQTEIMGKTEELLHHENSKLKNDLSTAKDTIDRITDEKSKLKNDLAKSFESIHLLNEAIREVDRLKNTLSWKITAPLRWVRKIQIDAVHSLRDIYYQTYIYRLNQNILKFCVSVLPRSVAEKLVTLSDSKDNFERRHSRSEISRQPVSKPSSALYWPRESYLRQFPGSYHTPLVSIIVPNYNHAPYLEKRLESIYSQTYRNYEVIMLDDCSRDDSREILTRYRESFPEKTKTVFNQKNSGSAFHQWNKGISLASGDLVWIAESDDWCTDNFLEVLIRYFNDEAVMLAYCRSSLIDATGNKQIWSIEEYLSDINPELWKTEFIKTAHHIVNYAWAIKNIIPNVSSAVFRHPGQLELLKDDAWQQMRICGDWIFYLNIIRGGLVAYSPHATNFYRIHNSNTSISTYSNDSFYMEHERVAQCVNQLYSVPEYIFMLQREIIKKHWIQNRPSFTEERLDRCYSIEEIKKSRKNRKPNILMVGYAFAAGGGETFPIQLANLLKGCGYGVTFLNCDQEERNEDIRKMLRNDIPIVNNYYFLEKITVEFDIDIIHSHHAWADNAILDILPENTQCRTIVTIHGMYEMMEGGELKKILPRLLKRTDKIVYIADKNLKPFINYRHFNKHRHKFIKIDNALPIEDIEPINLNALNIPSDAFVLCLVSRAIPEKGWKEAVESVKRARELSGRNIHLLLIGEGEEHNYFKLLNLPSYLHLLGFRNNIRAYYAASHMGFLPSRFEGESCPLTLIDCLLAGKPVIASNIGEIPRMLESAGTISGVLFPLDSNGEIPVPQVADIIAQCATNEVYYENMKKAVPAAAAKFKPEVMRNKYEQVYMEVMGRSKTKSRKLNSDE